MSKNSYDQMAEEEDPFGSLTINFCQPISSDILKFQDCPVLLESPCRDPVSDVEQTPLTQTPFEPVTEIHPPGSDRDEDTPSVTPLDNNEIHAPPEHHNRRSFSSSQEFLFPRENPAVNPVIHHHVLQKSCVDDDIQLEGGENVHFPGTVQSNGSDGVLGVHWSDNVIGSDAGPEERMDEKAVEEDRVEPFSMDSLDFAAGKSVGCLKDTTNEGICVTSADSNSTAMDLEDVGGVNIEERLDKKAVEEDRVEPCCVGNLDSVPGKSVGGNRDSNEGIRMTNLDSMEENGGISMHSEGLENVIATLDCEIKRVEGTKELIDCGSDGVDETCMTNSVNLSIKASFKAVNMEENALKQKDGESCSGSKNTKEIESFRYEGCSSDKRYLAKEVVSRGRRDLPLSIRGKDNEARNVKVKKRSWKELIEAFEVYFKRDDSIEDVDFLETAKRRGLTFP